jgi:hypothetical protein
VWLAPGTGLGGWPGLAEDARLTHGYGTGTIAVAGPSACGQGSMLGQGRSSRTTAAVHVGERALAS